MGAFLRHTPKKLRKISSINENFSHAQKIAVSSPGVVGVLELFSNLTTFPLLQDPVTYNPDTSDLSDPKLQMYWIDLLDKNLKDLVGMVMGWQKRAGSLEDKSAAFENLYRTHLQRLRKEPNAYGVLSVRRYCSS
jgi:bifunctional damage-control phosphatase, subfamily II, fusion protein